MDTNQQSPSSQHLRPTFALLVVPATPERGAAVLRGCWAQGAADVLRWRRSNWGTSWSFSRQNGRPGGALGWEKQMRKKDKNIGKWQAIKMERFFMGFFWGGWLDVFSLREWDHPHVMAWMIYRKTYRELESPWDDLLEIHGENSPSVVEPGGFSMIQAGDLTNKNGKGMGCSWFYTMTYQTFLRNTMGILRKFVGIIMDRWDVHGDMIPIKKETDQW